MASAVRVVLNPVEIQAMIDGPTGPIVRDLFVRGERVKIRAIQEAPIGKPDPLGRSRGPGGEPGNLRRHIVKRFVLAGKTPQMWVGAEHVPYAIWVHEGSQPHEIRPKNGPFLVFMGRDGNVVFTKLVHHPGNKPNRFLIRALPAAAG